MFGYIIFFLKTTPEKKREINLFFEKIKYFATVMPKISNLSKSTIFVVVFLTT